MEKTARDIMIERNYAAFTKLLDEQWDELAQHENKYAIVREGKIVKIFASPVAALSAGANLYKDKMFSIQEIAKDPVELGYYSYVVSDSTS